MTVPAAITVDRAKTYLGIPAGLTMHDDFLEYLISSATEIVAERFNLTSGLTAHTYNDTVDIEDYDQHRIRLPR